MMPNGLARLEASDTIVSTCAEHERVHWRDEEHRRCSFKTELLRQVRQLQVPEASSCDADSRLAPPIQPIRISLQWMSG